MFSNKTKPTINIKNLGRNDGNVFDVKIYEYFLAKQSV